MSPAEDGVAVEYNGRHVLLKWHKLRRKPDDPPFAPDNLKAGVALGASLEVDIRLLADDTWICLHDAVLDNETNGVGPVGAIDSEVARQLRIAKTDYAPPFLADVAAQLRAAGPGVCLQLDLKEGVGAISSRAIATFEAVVAPFARHCLLSGDDWEAVQKLGRRIIDLRLGFDPYELAAARRLERRRDVEDFLSEVVAFAPTASAFYLYHGFVITALAVGCNPIEVLKASGAIVDAWTLDRDTPNIDEILAKCIEAGADQITTNDSLDIAKIWRSRK
jgi:glycerophosphoryl diester phosphodiesterase